MPRRASAPPFNVDWIASSASRPRLFSPADVRPGETVPTRGACGRPPCAAAGTGPHSAGGRPQAKKGSNATTKSSPWIGTWRHYCLTYVRRNVTLYVDGQRETSWNATVNTSASALYVGADVNGSHTLSGAVDVGVTDVALADVTVAEVGVVDVPVVTVADVPVVAVAVAVAVDVAVTDVADVRDVPVDV